MPRFAVVQRCGGHACPPTGCLKDGDELHRAAKAVRPDGRPSAPAIVGDVVSTAGSPLPAQARRSMGERFGYDFGSVRIHTDTQAADSARAVHAEAYTVGRHVVFGAGGYQPDSPGGQRLLAHELAHVVQQSATPAAPESLGISDPSDASEREAAAHAATYALPSPSHEPAAVARQDAGTKTISGSAGPSAVQRQHRPPSPVSARSPFLEETVTQLSDVAAGLTGRALTEAERTIAARIFGTSIDISRVRLIPTDVLEYRTVGNNIRMPKDFTIVNQDMAQTLVHELTHVWQYQHGGTAYMSHSVQTQIVGALRGNRNFAYDYELKPGGSFFDFTPEQQAFIVENYFAMKRDQIDTARVTGSARTYSSNHLGPDGFPKPLSSAQRTAEISRELPAHELVIAQMRAAMPEAEQAILLQRASEVMQTRGSDLSHEPTRELAPLKPVFSVTF
jgi:hypothetical protein